MTSNTVTQEKVSKRTKPAPLPDIIKANEINDFKTQASKTFFCLKLPTEHPLNYYPKDDYDLKSNKDWIRKGFTPKTSLDTPYQPEAEGVPTMKSLQDMRDAIANEPEADDLIQDLLPDSNSAYSLIAGRSGIGKTFLLLNVLYCLASGTPFMSRKAKKCKVGYISLEGDSRKILKRFNTMGLSFPGAEDNIFWEHRMPFRLNSKGIDWLTAKVGGLDVVGIDPIRPLIPGDYTNPRDVGVFLENLREVQNKTGVVVIGTHHIRKPDKRVKVQPEDLLFEIKGASEFVESATSVLLLERGNQQRDGLGKFTSNSDYKSLHFVKIKDAPAEPIPLTLRFNDEKLLFEPLTDDFT